MLFNRELFYHSEYNLKFVRQLTNTLQGEGVDAIPKDLVDQCCQLVKANSIQG